MISFLWSNVTNRIDYGELETDGYTNFCVGHRNVHSQLVKIARFRMTELAPRPLKGANSSGNIKVYRYYRGVHKFLK